MLSRVVRNTRIILPTKGTMIQRMPITRTITTETKMITIEDCDAKFEERFGTELIKIIGWSSIISIVGFGCIFGTQYNWEERGCEKERK